MLAEILRVTTLALGLAKPIADLFRSKKKRRMATDEEKMRAIDDEDEKLKQEVKEIRGEK